MAQKLPTWSWILVGLVITIVSWSVEMELFVWLGLLFIAVGAAKIIISYMTGKETHQERKAEQHAPAAHPSHQYYRCYCGNPVRATDSFCSACGRRLR
jgi:hypothetical protein